MALADLRQDAVTRPCIDPGNEILFYVPSDGSVTLLMDDRSQLARACPCGENNLPAGWVGKNQAEIASMLGEGWVIDTAEQMPSPIEYTYRINFRRKN